MIPSLYSNTILSDSPLAYCRLGELAGATAFDSSGNVRDATINGGVTLGATGALSKDRDTAMIFDGNSGYIAVPSSVIQGTTGTWECWFKLSTLNFTTNPRLIANDNVGSSHNGFELGISAGAGSIFANLGYGTANAQVAYSTTLFVGVWYHVVVTFDGTTAILYLNGINVAQTTVGHNLTAGANAYNIGRNPAYSGDYFPGSLDEPAFYSGVLSAARVTARYNAGTYTLITSSQDTFLNKFQVIKVYASDRATFLGLINDATYITGIKSNINAADDAVHIILPRAIDAYNGANQPGSDNTIVMGNNIQIWIYGAGLPTGGLLKLNGFIDNIDPKLDESGSQSVDVLVTPYSQLALGDAAVTSTVTFGTAGSSSTYIDTGAIFQSFFSGSYTDSTGTVQSTIDADTGQPYCYPFTMDPTSVALTQQKTQFAFQNQDMLSTLTDDLQLSPPNFFFRMNQSLTTYFGVLPSMPTYTLLLGQHISSIEFPQDNVPRKNVIIIKGKGVSGKYVGSSVSTIGKRTYFKSDNRITDTNTAQQLANGLGAIYDRTIIRAKLKIPDNRGDSMPGLGYDIEKFRVGETVKIVDARAPSTSATGTGSVWGSFIWGQGKWGAPSSGQPTIWGSFTWGQAVWGSSLGTVFNTVLPIMAVNWNFHYVELEVGWRAPTVNRKVFDVEAALADATLVS